MRHEALKIELRRLSSLAKGDPDLTKRLLADATEVVKEHGVELPPDHKVIAVLHDDALELFLLPVMVDEGELTIGELEQVAGGMCINPFGMGNQTSA